LVLHSACSLDVLAPLRCPSSIISAAAGARVQLLGVLVPGLLACA